MFKNRVLAYGNYLDMPAPALQRMAGTLYSVWQAAKKRCSGRGKATRKAA